MNKYEWLQSHDTGISSRTIFYVMTGIVSGTNLRCNFEFNIPNDPDDFGRCYRLLKHFPAWRDRLQEVSDAFPKWKPLVDNWSELEILYEQELSNRSPSPSFLYARIRELYHECMIAEGWTRTGMNSYSLIETRGSIE